MVLGSNQPPFQWVRWTTRRGVKQAMRKVDSSLPLNSKVQNEWTWNLTPPHA